MSVRSSLQSRSWSKDQYFISTDASLLPLDKINDALESDAMYWCKGLPEEVLKETLDNSLCFGLYEKQQREEASLEPEFLGLARCITDFTTTLYLTDVWVRPDQQGKGLGKWMVQCVQSVIEEMPHLRRSLLFTSDWDKSVTFYKQHMKMKVFGGDDAEKARASLAMMQHIGPGMGNALKEPESES